MDFNISDNKSSDFLHSFWRVNRNLMRIVHNTAQEYGLSIPQYSVLMIIAPRKEMTQKQLGEILQIPKSTLSQAVDGLVQTEWIHRQPVQDNRREMQLIISEKGNALFEKISIHQTIETVINTIGSNQYEEFQNTLHQIAKLLETNSIPKECIQND